jgi:gliding motility-associated-like protein
MIMRKKLQLTTATDEVLLRLTFYRFLLKSGKNRLRGSIGFRMILSILFLCISLTGYSQLPIQNFESGIPSSWSLFNGGVGTGTWATTPNGYLGGNAAFINPSAYDIGAGNSAEYFMVTPNVTIPTKGEIRFYTKRATSGTNDSVDYQIRLSTASQPDINGFNVILKSWNGNDLNDGADNEYEEKVIDIPESLSGLNVYIAFVAVHAQTGATVLGDAWYIDNVRVIEGCLKLESTDVTFTGITPLHATVNWAHPNVTNFQVQIVPQGAAPTATGNTVNGNTFTFNDLIGNTSYDVYIKTVCDSETASAWAGPFNFRTSVYGLSCATPIIVTASSGSPYSLDANLMDFPNADTVLYPNQGSNCLSSTTTGNYLLGNKIFLSYTADQDGVISLSQKTLPWTSGTQCWGNSISGVFIYEDCSAVGIECLAGLNTTATNQPKTIENFSVTAGTTYIIVISSTYSGTAASICFEFDLSFTTCPAPSKFKYKNLLQESVTFSWDNPVNMASAWEYVVLPTTDPAPTGAGTFTAINENVSIGGLTAGTSYNLYIRSICGGIAGGWSAPYTFTTQCAIFETPYSTGFEGRNATNPEPCWTSIDLNGDGVKWSYLGGWEDGYLGYATLQTNTNQNFNKDYIVSPQVNFTGGQKRLRYAHQISGGTSSSYSIKISTTGIGEENFTYVLVPERVITNTVWQEVIYNIPETITGTVNIAWVVSPLGSGQNTTRISITNVYIEDKPICPDPILPVLATGSITTTSAQFSWTTGDVETQWEVIAIPVNDEEPTATTSGIITNSNPYTFTDLNPASRYKFYVRAYCSTEHQSNWVGPVNFITECIVFPIPFYESFNNLDNTTKKFCWTINNANSDGASWIMNADSPTIQGSTSWFNPTSSYNDWLISPAISGVGVKELRYSYKAVFSMFHLVSRYGLQIMISHTDTNPASFTELVPLEEFTNTDFLEKSVYFNANGTFYIAFRVPPHFSIPPGTSILNLDDVYIIDAPECPKPRTLVAQNILSNSANLSWNAGFEETQWEIANQIVGSGVPNSGTIVNTVNYSATLLNSGTIYEFYVRSVCGTDSVSEWVGPFTYTTLCDPFTTPFVETFNTTSTSKDCWRVLNVNNDDFTFVRNVTTGTYEGDYAIGMFTGSNGANDDYLISPTITVTENQRLKFYYRVNSKWFVEDLRVLLSTTGIEPNAFTTVLFDSEVSTLTINNEEYLEMILNIPSGITGNVNFAWHIPTMPGGPQGFRGQILIIDKVTVENIPVCPVPYNVAVSNITDTTVTVNWEVAGNESAWEVVVQPHGEVAPTATSNPLYTHTATAHPFVVNDLDPAIQYDVFVRAVCGSENQWVGPQVFNTLCSFENLCEYTVTLHSGATNYTGVGGGINVMQNGVLVQTLEFPTGAWYDTMEPVDFILYLCNGVEFSLYWDAVGTAPGQYPDAYVKVTNSDGIEVWISELGIGTPRTVIHTGITSCGVITCQQPTDLTVNELSELSWTAGGIETQWEVAIQPYRNGTLPQIGTLVTTPSYTPSSLDFTGNSNVYEFFVKAICAEGNGSFWSGPYAFVINDDKSNAQVLQTNTDGECNVSSIVSFNHSLVSSDVMSCSGINGGDVWYEFVATSKTHLIELNSFEGDYYYEAGGEPHAKASLVLYKELGNGDLEEMVCSYNNVIATLYSTELVEGATYKIRVVLNETYNSTRTFNICIKTIVDPCNFAGINGGFEDPEVSIGLLNNMISQNVIPGWRYNLYGYWSNGAIFYLDALNTIGLTPYEGGSLIQMFSSDDEHVLDLNNIDGLYQDFDSSEISQFKYSFAHASRTGGNNLKLYAGTPGGTFTEVHSSTVSTMGWQLNEGVYNVPANQPITRFVFRAESGAIGTLLDGISISDNNKVQILTDNQVVGCGEFVELESVGTGTWSADENNPGVVTISNASSNTIQINDFITPGEYTFYWKSRYCSDSVVVTYNGFEDVPTVVTPVQYCLNNVAEPLTATASTGYTLLYFTEEVGGTGETTITPSTALTGTTTYYVANVSDTGCVGQRVAIEVVVNELTPQVATFNYNASAYCSMGSNPTISLSEGFATGGEFQVSPTIGLLVDSATGAIDLTNSVAGEYNITYTLLANGCNDAASHSETITITEATAVTTTFTYATPVCKLQTGLSPTLDGSAATGGRFTSTTLTIDEATGVITGVVTPGTHTIRYEVLANPANCTLGGSSEFEIVVNDAITPVVVFTYNTSYCTLEANPRPELAANFTNGGTFSGNNGLPIDATTGAINLATATPGVYGVTYAITENIENCIVADSHTVQVVINAATPSVTDFSYANACAMSTSQMPQLDVNFTSGGSFSSSGIEVNPVTGQVNLAGVATGTYSITYSVNQNVAACTTAGEYTATITVTEGQTTVTGFSYESEYCSNAGNDLPTTVAGFDFSGRFEGTPGLVIDTQTGEINFAASTLGNHIVTYTVDANEVLCVLGNSSSATISIVSGESIVVADRCEGNAYVLLVNGSANYTWTDANNTVVGTGNSFNVKEFLNENSSVSLPFTVHVSADGNACMSTGMFTITSIPCLDIPRGISPNGDGLNDAFDLRGMNVRSVVIFNRYGTEVYKFNGNYTNQWYGQTNNDNDLPAATYFYSITKADGSSVTGWVYINR